MPLILHIFRKDATHLWKEISVTWALLAWLTHADSWRAGDTPGSTEGWLNLLVPLVWSYLIALCVLQDPVPGERQFWLTLPHTRVTLVAAKGLFIAAFIHLPYLISTAVVVSARGFDPLHFLPRLLQKQLFLLVALTLPSLALASIARNAMQFIILAISLAGAAILVAGDGDPAAFSYSRIPWVHADEGRYVVTLLVLALGSIAVAWLQYRERRTLLSRITGFAGVLAAAALYLWMPLRSSASLEAALSPVHPGSPVSVRALPRGQKPDPVGYYSAGNTVNLAIPIEIDVNGTQHHFRLARLALEINAPGGLHFRAGRVNPGRKPPSFVAGAVNSQPRPPWFLASPGAFGGTRFPDTRLPDFLIMTMERSVYNRVARIPVTVTGQFLLEGYRRTAVTTVPNNARTIVPDLGMCGSSTSGGGLFREDMLVLSCESPEEIPLTSVALTDISTGLQWQGGLRTAVTNVPYPSNTWLSPMRRGEAFFQLNSGDVSRPGSQWQAPLAILGHYRFEVDPQPVVGLAAVDFEFRGIELSRFVNTRPR
jgi:hypothetical protein